MVTIHQVEAALPPPGHDHEVGNARRSTRSPARPPIECTGLPPTVGLGHRCRTVLPSSQLVGFVPCATPRAELADANPSERERSAQAQWAGAVSCTRERARTNRCCSCVGLTPPSLVRAKKDPGTEAPRTAMSARTRPGHTPSGPSVAPHHPVVHQLTRGTPSGRTW